MARYVFGCCPTCFVLQCLGFEGTMLTPGSGLDQGKCRVKQEFSGYAHWKSVLVCDLGNAGRTFGLFV